MRLSGPFYWIATKVLKLALWLDGAKSVRLRLSGTFREAADKCDITRVTYAVALCGPCDELLVATFNTEPEVRKFISMNPVRGVEGPDAVTEGPLAEAFNVRGCGPSQPFGYVVTELYNGVPHRQVCVDWEGDPHPFDPTVPIFPLEASVC